jgi:hypothetical protein
MKSADNLAEAAFRCPSCGRGPFENPKDGFVCPCGYSIDEKGVEFMDVAPGYRVAFEKARVLLPALDSNPTEILILTLPLKSDLHIPTRRTDKAGSTVYEDIKDVALYTVTDKREIFPCTKEEFYKRNWLAKIPEPMISQRWSPQGDTGVAGFLMGRSPTIDAGELFERIRSKFDWFCDLGSPFMEGAHETNCYVSALYFVMSYFFFLFEYVPYLKAGGLHGSGKTKWGRLFLAMAFNAKTSSDVRKTTVYRTVQDTRGCLLIDEAESLSSQNENNRDLISILNSGWEKVGNVPLVDKETMRVTNWSTFSPKVIIAINDVYEVLADRTFQIPFFKTLDRKKAEREPDSEAEEWWAIRDGLYLLLMQNWKRVKDLSDQAHNHYEFNGRLWNLAKPLIVIARLVDPEKKSGVEDQLFRFLENQVKSKQENVDQSLAGTILNVLEEMLKQESLGESDDYRFYLELAKVTAKVCEMEGTDKITTKRVSKVLKALGLYRNPKRAGSTGGYAFEVSKDDVKSVRARQSISASSERAEQTEGSEGAIHTEDDVQNKATEPPFDHSGASEISSEPSVCSATTVSTSRGGEASTASPPTSAHAHIVNPRCWNCGKEIDVRSGERAYGRKEGALHWLLPGKAQQGGVNVTPQASDVLQSCRHRFIFDESTGEVLCENGCGWAVGAYEQKERIYASDARKLSSPSVRDRNLGSDQNDVIRDLRRAVKDPETGKTKHILSGALRFFPNNSNRDEDLVEELSNRLHGNVSDSELAAIAQIFRQELRSLEREKRKKALQALNQITGESSK